jgi:mannose/cellobiose epimerase-like protein (N-acyl-D-glucosamine 2-epimerase family)
MKSKFLVPVLFALMGTSLYASAGQDETQRQMIQRVTAARHKLQQAEAAKGEQRKALMTEHMSMMNENMDMMAAMKPRAGMSMKDHEQWIEEHQKLMRQMMDQMMGEHHLMMEAK